MVEMYYPLTPHVLFGCLCCRPPTRLVVPASRTGRRNETSLISTKRSRQAEPGTPSDTTQSRPKSRTCGGRFRELVAAISTAGSKFLSVPNARMTSAEQSRIGTTLQMKSLVTLIVALLVFWVGLAIILTLAVLGSMFVESLLPHMNFIENCLASGVLVSLSAFIVIRGAGAAIEPKSPEG